MYIYMFIYQSADSIIAQVLSLLQSFVANKAVSLTADAQAIAAVKRVKYEPLPIEGYTITNTDQECDWHTDNSAGDVKQRKIVMTKLHYTMRQLQHHDSSSNANTIDDQLLQWIVQYIEYSQFRAATDVHMYSNSDTLVTRWQWISQQFIAELQLATTAAGKRKYAKYGSSSSSSSNQKADSLCINSSSNAVSMTDSSSEASVVVKHEAKRHKSNSSSSSESSNAQVHNAAASQQQQQQQQHRQLQLNT
jgi:hypothetical protein